MRDEHIVEKHFCRNMLANIEDGHSACKERFRKPNHTDAEDVKPIVL